MRNDHRTLPTALLLTAATLTPTLATAQQSLLDAVERWEINGAAEIVSEMGEATLRIPAGGATLKELDFTDGTVMLEMRVTSRPSFVGFHFRAGEQDTEHIYFRPHKSGLWDAIQYQPIMNGSSSWQTHTGPGFSQAVALPAGEWIPVRLEVRGDQADLYVGRAERPTMQLELQHGARSGTIILSGGFRGDPNPSEPAISFRRVSVVPGSPTLSARPAAEPAGDFLRQWWVSEPFAIGETPVRRLPQTNSGSLIEVTAEPRGLVNLNRYFSRVADAEYSAVVAEVALISESDANIALDFNYSDNLSIFLDGNLVYSGSNYWQSRHPLYLGVISPDNLVSSVLLPLKRGRNLLSLAVSEQAFGWGFYARLSGDTTVEISRP